VDKQGQCGESLGHHLWGFRGDHEYSIIISLLNHNGVGIPSSKHTSYIIHFAGLESHGIMSQVSFPKGIPNLCSFLGIFLVQSN
jgi:hypothetical protein